MDVFAVRQQVHVKNDDRD